VIADAYQPYLVFLPDKNRPFAFAGIYDQWKDPESKEIVTSFAIITTVANSLLQSIGVKRMPVILSRSEETYWVKSSSHLSDALVLLNPYPAENMNAYPVSEMANIPGMNDPSMLNPVGEKLQKEFVAVRVESGYHHKEKPKTDTPWFKGE